METKMIEDEEKDSPRWRLVYITVIIYTAALIAGLWAFSQIYT